jgi:FAD/FMN-containing dehydrogenase
MLSQEIRLPSRFLGKALREWKAALSDERFAFKGAGSDNGAVNVMPVIMTDERNKKDFFRSTSYTYKIAQIGKKYHGSVYGIGLFNSYQMRQIHGESLEVMREIKRELDPKNILNPYKTVESRIPSVILIFMFKLMKLAPSFFVILARLTKYLPAVFLKTVIKLLQGRK